MKSLLKKSKVREYQFTVIFVLYHVFIYRKRSIGKINLKAHSKWIITWRFINTEKDLISVVTPIRRHFSGNSAESGVFNIFITNKQKPLEKNKTKQVYHYTSTVFVTTWLRLGSWRLKLACWRVPLNGKSRDFVQCWRVHRADPNTSFSFKRNYWFQYLFDIMTNCSISSFNRQHAYKLLSSKHLHWYRTAHVHDCVMSTPV